VINGTGVIFNALTPIVIDPLFAALFRDDAFYANAETTKYSLRKISEEYMYFTEGIKMRYPGYDLDEHNLVVNKSDIEIDLQSLRDLLISSDIDSYQRTKDLYFSAQPRFLD